MFFQKKSFAGENSWEFGNDQVTWRLRPFSSNKSYRKEKKYHKESRGNIGNCSLH